MLKTSKVVTTPSVERLLKLWAQRYIPNLSSLSLENSASYNSLLEAASLEGRALTANKLKANVLDVNCQMAWIQTKSLYAYISNILDLSEARRITQFAFRVYRKLLEIYQNRSVGGTSATGDFPSNSYSSLGIPAIADLSYALEPILLVFQEQHIASKDWRALGFLTTQINFSNKLIQKKLSPQEKVLLAPYLKFVEEQVAIPWQRVCVASAKYELDSLSYMLVEQMLPAASDISESAYRRLVELLPNHRSRRGDLTDSAVTHSCLRDLNMFQAYLWLCFLERSMAPLEKELLPLCVMVVEAVEIKWAMIEKWCEVLTDEMISRLQPEQQELLQPYTQGMQEIFFNQRSRLGFRGVITDK
jgi:Phycobilisome protein